MGTYVKIRIVGVVIPASRTSAAHKALGDLLVSPPEWLVRRRSASLVPYDGFYWVRARESGWPTLVEELLSWRYESRIRADGSVRLVRFRGEKWGDDEVLYRAVAPYVEGPGRIDVVGEELRMRYSFRDGGLQLEMSGSRGWEPCPFWGDGPEVDEARRFREKHGLGVGGRTVDATGAGEPPMNPKKIVS
ncbi:MAG: hypothetical protein ABID40_03120 [Candidatus Bipolaricaulota bacterium]